MLCAECEQKNPIESHSNFVCVRASLCARSVNKKIRLKSHSGFVYARASCCARNVNDMTNIHPARFDG